MSLLEIDTSAPVLFTWDYVQKNPALTKLYEKGKASHWNVQTDVDWTPEVNFGEEIPPPPGFEGMQDLVDQMIKGSPLESLPGNEKTRFRWEMQSWMVSQFMHGEQGALIATARLVETTPTIDAKYYAAVQVMDEARHVEAYAKYLCEKLRHSYAISKPLEALLEDIVTETRWDITYLGMQIMVEGLALAAFGLANVMFQDPIVKQITDLIMRDEARHVAFGVLSLQGIYEEMTSVEIREREDFVIEASTLMRDRFLLDDVWERMGIDVEEGKKFANEAFPMIAFRQMLFSKIVPNINKLGLLTDRVRPHFEALGVIQHEHNLDSATELDPSLVA
ncbi:MAG: ferritin-like domain-containing protein [Actinobacteria bacterium ATB1]|nr:ferritin-like domain-containing protein [Actinobacteria bacterium ATB1]